MRRRTVGWTVLHDSCNVSMTSNETVYSHLDTCSAHYCDVSDPDETLRMDGDDDVAGDDIKPVLIKQARCEDRVGFRDMEVYRHAVAAKSYC